MLAWGLGSAWEEEEVWQHSMRICSVAARGVLISLIGAETVN